MQFDELWFPMVQMESSATLPTSPEVEITNLAKVFSEGTEREVVAIEDLSMQVKKSEIVALLGPSGCGKSTLLKMVAGLISPTRGEITIAGKEVSKPSADIGVMFQKPLLLPWLTVIDNTLLPHTVQGVKREVNLEAAKELIEFVGLDGFANHYPGQLSGGMQQRVAICRMLVTEPRLYLLDEPFGALDELTREYLDIELRQIIQRKGQSAILVTHNPVEAAFIADRIVVMSRRPGKIVGQVEVSIPEKRSSELFATETLNKFVREARVLLEISGRIGIDEDD